MAHAKLLTKDYLEYLGVTEVSTDGTKIMKGDKEVSQHDTNGYKTIFLYDPAIRQVCPIDERNNATGQIILGVHRVVYAWYHKVIPEGLVVDHKNSNKLDNRLENLQLLTPKDNVNKERVPSTTELKCKLNKPRSFYEAKLNSYTERYEQAKLDKDSELCHKLRCNIAQCRARLRYWDKHSEEYEAYLKAHEAEIQQKEEKAKEKALMEAVVAEAKAQRKADAEIKKKLRAIATEYRLRDNKQQWHMFMNLLKNFDALPREKLEEITTKTLERLGI